MIMMIMMMMINMQKKFVPISKFSKPIFFWLALGKCLVYDVRANCVDNFSDICTFFIKVLANLLFFCH